LAERFEESFIADPIELACDRLKADVAIAPPFPARFRPPCSSLMPHAAQRDETAHRAGTLLDVQFGAIQVVQPSWPNLPIRIGSAAPDGIAARVPIQLLAL